MSYKHAVDKAFIPTLRILGVDIAAIDMEWLVKFTTENIEKLRGDYICVANVHTTVIAFEDEAYRTVQNGGVMAIPDGGPLSAIGSKRGATNMSRTTGPSYMEEILKISAEHGWKHFFYGSTQETLDKLKKRLDLSYPKVKIVGMYSPPFHPMTIEEDEEVVKMIGDVSPDFLWIGLGAPKQEKWMAEHQGRVAGLMIGVGAAFDYFAGN